MGAQSNYFQEEISMWESEFDGLQSERDALAAKVSEQHALLGEARGENTRLLERLRSSEVETAELARELEGQRATVRDRSESAGRSEAESQGLKRRLPPLHPPPPAAARLAPARVRRRLDGGRPEAPRGQMEPAGRGARAAASRRGWGGGETEGGGAQCAPTRN